MFANTGFADAQFADGDDASSLIAGDSGGGTPTIPVIPGFPELPSLPESAPVAEGTVADFLAREKSTLPTWFSDRNPILDALLSGLAASWSWVYSLVLYAKLQTRIRTASDGWLDLIAGDFFGTRIARRSNQGDASFRATIIANLFRERTTRTALIQVLTDLTGRAPIVIEPQRPADCGAYGVPTSGYGVAGYYGSLLLPSQAFLIAFRPASSGIPGIAGYGNAPAAYGTPSRGGMYASLSMIQGHVSDDDIMAAIDSVRPVGTVIWTAIKS